MKSVLELSQFRFSNNPFHRLSPDDFVISSEAYHLMQVISDVTSRVRWNKANILSLCYTHRSKSRNDIVTSIFLIQFSFQNSIYYVLTSFVCQ